MLPADSPFASPPELGPHPDLAALRAYAAGALPASPAACSAYVLTGSPAGVYDDLPWIAPLLGFLRQARGQVDGGVDLGIGAGAVVKPNRLLLGRRVQHDLAERHQDIGAICRARVDLARPGDRTCGDRAWLLLVCHRRLPCGMRAGAGGNIDPVPTPA